MTPEEQVIADFSAADLEGVGNAVIGYQFGLQVALEMLRTLVNGGMDAGDALRHLEAAMGEFGPGGLEGVCHAAREMLARPRR